MTVQQPSHSGLSSPDPEREIGGRRYLILSLYVPAIGMGFGFGLTTPVLPELAKSFGAGAGLATLLFATAVVGSVLATLPTGYFIDRVGRKHVLLVGPIIAAIAALLMVRAASYPELLAYRFLGGWGAQMWALARLTMIADMGAAQQRGTQYASMHGVSRIGTLLGPAVGGAVATTFGLGVPFVMHAALILVSGVLPTLLVVKETAPLRAKADGLDQAQGKQRLSARLFLKSPMPQIQTAAFLSGMARGGIEAGGVLFVYAAYAYGAKPATVGALGSAAAIASLPVVFLAGRIMDRQGRKYTIVPGSLLLSAAMGLIALTSLAGLPFAAFIGAFFGVHLSTSLLAGSMQTVVSDVAPEFARGTFFGVSRFVNQAGRLSSPTSFGLLSELASFGAAFFFLSAAALGSGLIMALFVRETLFKTTPRAS